MSLASENRYASGAPDFVGFRTRLSFASNVNPMKAIFMTAFTS